MENPDILVVDDDSDLRRTLAVLLGKSHKVAEASGGAEALSLLKTLRPRLVLLDVTMPEMSGIEVLRAARAIHGALRVVMLTSRQELEIAKSALDLGAIAYMTKPFDAIFIRAEVARLLKPADGETDGGRPWRVVEK